MVYQDQDVDYNTLLPLGENQLLYVTTEIDADHSVITSCVAKLDLR